MPTATRSRKASASDGGCDFAVDPFPDQSAASVFWLPEDDTSVVILASAPSCLARHDDGAQLPRAAVTETELEGVYALLDLGNGERLQVLATVAAPAAAVIPLDRDGFGRLEALHRLLSAIHRRAIPPATPSSRSCAMPAR